MIDVDEATKQQRTFKSFQPSESFIVCVTSVISQMQTCMISDPRHGNIGGTSDSPIPVACSGVKGLKKGYYSCSFFYIRRHCIPVVD